MEIDIDAFHSEWPPGSAQAQHPDLVEIERTLRRRLDRVLEAEQEAARVIARRSATFRDRLIDVEDANERVQIRLRNGDELEGMVAAVAMDHVEVHSGRRATLLSLDMIASVTFP